MCPCDFKCVKVPAEARKGASCPGTGVPGDWELKEQHVLLTAESSLGVMTETKHSIFSSGLYINKKKFLSFTHDLIRLITL